VEVVRDVTEDLPWLVLAPDRIKQAFLNLVLNAIEAMPDGGQLRVSTNRTDDPAGVNVSFADTGPGIAPDALPRIFDPFYTTKPEGLGLGLYITRNVVEEHRGRVEVESLLGEGATFTVWLPTGQDMQTGEA
jgi:signal transduction histidine kinase